MDFTEALLRIKAGAHLTRAAWESDRIFVHIDSIGVISLTRPADPRELTTGTWPWQPGSDDMMADDWSEVVTE